MALKSAGLLSKGVFGQVPKVRTFSKQKLICFQICYLIYCSGSDHKWSSPTNKKSLQIHWRSFPNRWQLPWWPQIWASYSFLYRNVQRYLHLILSKNVQSYLHIIFSSLHNVCTMSLFGLLNGEFLPGFGVMLGHVFMEPATINYPFEKGPLSSRFRYFRCISKFIYVTT